MIMNMNMYMNTNMNKDIGMYTDTDKEQGLLDYWVVDCTWGMKMSCVHSSLWMIEQRLTFRVNYGEW
jgi:hypothetical protein